MKLIETIPKIVGDVACLIEEIERIESATDSTEILIADIAQTLSMPLIEGMRQLGIYDDPNVKNVKKLYITELFNFEDIRANSTVESASEYISTSNEHYMNYKDNIEQLRAGFIQTAYDNDKDLLQHNSLKTQTYNLFIHILGHDYHKFAGITFNKDTVTVELVVF